MANFKWDPSPEFLAQAAHLLFGAVAVLAGHAAGGPHGGVLGTWSIAIYVVLKEVFWDPATETDEPFFWEGFKDVGFFITGISLAWIWILVWR